MHTHAYTYKNLCIATKTGIKVTDYETITSIDVKYVTIPTAVSEIK